MNNRNKHSDAYRDGDFDNDEDIKSSTSCFMGLKEESRFLPNAYPKVRRTCSLDDVLSFHRYFNLVQSNRGKTFTWRRYASMLHDNIRDFKAPSPKPKSVYTLCSASPRSEFSTYTTASDTLGGPISYSSSVKKICNETRNLARELCAKVDRVLNLQPKGNTPTNIIKRKKHHVRTVGDSPDPSRYTSSQSEGTVRESDSSSSHRSPWGAGDSRTSKKTTSRKKKIVTRFR